MLLRHFSSLLGPDSSGVGPARRQGGGRGPCRIGTVSVVGRPQAILTLVQTPSACWVVSTEMMST